MNSSTTAMPAARPALSPTTIVLAIIAVSFVLRAIVATMMGFTFDESYHVVMAREPALGYSDHPPLTMWLIAASTRIFGSESHLVVRLPTLLLFAGTTWYLYRLTALLFGAQAGVLAIVLLNLSPQFGAFIGLVAITDGPVVFGLSAAACYLARALFVERPERQAWGDWLLAGVFFGVAALSKYTVVLSAAGVLVFLATTPAFRRWLVRPQLYAAIGVVLLTVSPMIVWNAGNDWASFVFQGRRAAFDGAIHYERFLRWLIGLFLMLMPPIFIGLLIALADGLKRGPADPKRWFCAWLAVVPVVFFGLVWLLGGQEARGYHWAAPGFLFAFPLLAAALVPLTGRDALWRRTIPLWGSFAVVMGAFLILVTHIATGWVAAVIPGFRQYDSLVADQTDWTSLRADLDAKGLLDPEKSFVVLARWEFCFKAIYVLGDRVKVVCLDDHPVGPTLPAEQADLVGKDAVIIGDWWRSSTKRADFEALFAQVSPRETVPITRYGHPVLSLGIAVARDLKQPFVARAYGPAGPPPPD